MHILGYLNYLAVVPILGFMILIHEFGHYAVAKMLGVRVEQFAIGFGKRLIGFRKGETDYRINLLPLGGYVKMSGENPMDDRTGDPGEFLSHPRWHRFLIAIAGPIMNILLAIGLLIGVYMVHDEYPAVFDKPTVIVGIKPDSPAAKAGIQVNDRIVAIDGIQNPGWEQVYGKVWLSANQPLDVTIQRGNQTFEKQIVPTPVTESDIGSAGWYSDDSVIVGDLESDMPAIKAGMQEDDKIVAIDGKPLPSIDAMIAGLQETKEKPVEVTVLRQGKVMNFNVQPVLAKTEDPNEKRYRLGFKPSAEMKVTSLGFGDAVRKSLAENKKDSLLILELVQKMVRGKISTRSIEGPIRIGQAAGEAAREKGWTPLLGLTSAISLNLGIFNLLPIPILDGGVILFLLLETLMGRDISLNIKERVYQAAFVFLVLFAVMVIYNDLRKTLPGMMP
ncbi:MAG TPA: RIP metalloprotease RseP [Terriglobales bacterium]|jgi:regulator of sigma E protease|nr:RIP metalloprotease RseP [Terriglobales bacterium]